MTETLIHVDTPPIDERWLESDSARTALRAEYAVLPARQRYKIMNIADGLFDAASCEECGGPIGYRIEERPSYAYTVDVETTVWHGMYLHVSGGEISAVCEDCAGE